MTMHDRNVLSYSVVHVSYKFETEYYTQKAAQTTIKETRGWENITKIII